MQKNLPSSIDLMPKPFDWIEIPNKGYSIAKYPVTNAQYAKFVEAGGYNEPKWWTEDGWKAREEGWHYDWDWKQSGIAWKEPRYWSDNNFNRVGQLWYRIPSNFNSSTQPVVGVSWYEAVAYCLWLSEVTGEKIMLPTTDQWQYAAQGDNNYSYAWGNEWDCNRCNNSVEPCYSRSTTPVEQYEGKGDSPFKVVDMTGNVWEWCLTTWEIESNDLNGIYARILHGGSWVNVVTDIFHCIIRQSATSHERSINYGFRLILKQAE